MRLRYVDPSSPGFTRLRRGRGFRIVNPDGMPADEATVERVRSLAVPPAWRDVWIAPVANAHLQATGIDAAGRRQYLYHPEWRTQRDRAKFDRMVEFAHALPALRELVQRDLALGGMPRERVLACAVRLLDRGFFRVGGEEYANENETFGLATLRREHVRIVDGSAALFDYPAKGGKRRLLRIADEDAVAVLAPLRRRRSGDELLAWQDGSGWCDVRSGDVNRYLKESTGQPEVSAKDFRTWHATVLAATSVAILGERATSPTARERIAGRAVREVSRYLGNTPAVCRASYVDPRVFERLHEGRTIDPALLAVDEAGLLRAERQVLTLLADARSMNDRKLIGNRRTAG